MMKKIRIEDIPTLFGMEAMPYAIDLKQIYVLDIDRSECTLSFDVIEKIADSIAFEYEDKYYVFKVYYTYDYLLDEQRVIHEKKRSIRLSIRGFHSLDNINSRIIYQIVNKKGEE